MVKNKLFGHVLELQILWIFALFIQTTHKGMFCSYILTQSLTTFKPNFQHYFLVWPKHMPNWTPLSIRFSERYIWGGSVTQQLRYRWGLKTQQFWLKLVVSADSAEMHQIIKIKMAFGFGNINKQLLLQNIFQILFTFGYTPFVYIYKQA